MVEIPPNAMFALYQFTICFSRALLCPYYKNHLEFLLQAGTEPAYSGVAAPSLPCGTRASAAAIRWEAIAAREARQAARGRSAG